MTDGGGAVRRTTAGLRGSPPHGTTAGVRFSGRPPSCVVVRRRASSGVVGLVRSRVRRRVAT
ncbi:MAG TPA: hypothetical protein DHV14_10705 [Micrococcales bacterium]|nr:hypothetical protein [Micrococcales bacterium]